MSGPFDLDYSNKKAAFETLDVSGQVAGGSMAFGAGQMTSLGYSLVPMAADANQTLTPAQYQASIIEMKGGTTLTATRNIVLPLTVGAEITVINGTTGAQALQFIGASGTGITVASNKSAVLWCDGTNWRRLTADT